MFVFSWPSRERFCCYIISWWLSHFQRSSNVHTEIVILTCLLSLLSDQKAMSCQADYRVWNIYMEYIPDVRCVCVSSLSLNWNTWKHCQQNLQKFLPLSETSFLSTIIHNVLWGKVLLIHTSMHIHQYRSTVIGHQDSLQFRLGCCVYFWPLK